ncbi:MAG: FISUMP domain-containing protein, partial [Bacteroidota bacterium]
MKKEIILFVIFFCAITLNAQQEPVIKFYMTDSSTKQFSINEIEKIGLISRQDNYMMKLVFQSSKSAYYILSNVDSLNFSADVNRNNNLNVYSQNTVKSYSLAVMDSIIFFPIGISQGEVRIGTQLWMQKNLDVATYRNGDTIPHVTNTEEWKNLKTGAWCYYNNDPQIGAVYGKLYNWYAVNDPRGLAPEGWHVPSDSEWVKLTAYLGGEDSAYGRLKESGVEHWQSLNIGATNETGFTALPGGCLAGAVGSFYNKGNRGYWWTSTSKDSSLAWIRLMSNDNIVSSRSVSYKVNGLSVRSIFNAPKIKNISTKIITTGDELIIMGIDFGSRKYPSFVSFNSTATTQFISWNDTLIKIIVPKGASSGKLSVTVFEQKSNEMDIIVIETVKIGTQIWMTRNLDVDQYRNGDKIPQITDMRKWISATTGAWCYYNNNAELGKVYGKLYNLYAIIDGRGLAPKDWHVSTYNEWTVLIDYLGGQDVASGKMK